MWCGEFFFGVGRMSLMFSVHLSSGLEADCCVYILFQFFFNCFPERVRVCPEHRGDKRSGVKEGFHMGCGGCSLREALTRSGLCQTFF